MADKQLNAMLDSAILLATKAHLGQTTWDGKPYILHPLHLMDQTDDMVLKIILVLRDVDEDTEVDMPHIESDLIAAGCGAYRSVSDVPNELNRIMRALKLLTHSPDQSYEEYIDEICENTLAMQAKKLDLEHNLSITRAHKIPKKLDHYVKAHKKITDRLKRISA